MAKEATKAAEKRAEEENVDLGKVEGTGKDGQVTAQDVDQAAQEPEKVFRVKLNEKLGQGTLGVIIEGRHFVGGETLTESEYTALGEANKHEPTAEHPSGFLRLLKNGEV